MKIIESKGIICKKGRNPKRLLALLFAAIVLTSIVLTASAEEWNGRMAINITNNGGSNLTNYPILVTLNNFDYSKTNPDGSDLRFTDYSKTVSYHYWIETWNTHGESRIWVKVPSIPVWDGTGEVPSANRMYMWYNNSAASSESDGDLTFEFFDDFDADLSKWHKYGSPHSFIDRNIGGHTNTLKLNGDGWYESGVYSDVIFSPPLCFEVQYYWDDYNLDDRHSFCGILGSHPAEGDMYASGSDEDYAVQRKYRNDTGLRFIDPSGSTNATQPYEEWANIMFCIDVDGSAKMYLNGVLIRESGPNSYTPNAINLRSHDPNYWVDTVRVRKYAYPEPTLVAPEQLTVDFSSAKVNEQSLVGDNPMISATPGENLRGYLEVTVNNQQPGNYITPVIGTCSWGRVISGEPQGWYEGIEYWVPTGSSIQRFDFEFTAPEEPGVYYIGVFAGWMYKESEVAANDHPARFGDHDDVWDMPLAGWDELIQYGRASSGPYHMPGRAIKVIVPSLQDPFIWSITCNPANIQLGDTMTVNVMVQNPLPYGGWCTLDLYLDKSQRQPYDLQDAARFWIDAQNNRNVNFVLQPQEVGRYSCKALLNWADHTGIPKQNVRNWAHCVSVGDVPHIEAILWNKREVLLGETVTASVIVRNPDIQTRNATWTLDIDQDLPNLNPECRCSSPVCIPPGGLNISNCTITPKQIGMYKQEANLSIGGTSVDWLPPQDAFKVVKVAEGPEPIQRITEVTFEVSPDVTTRVREPNGGETWITSGTHEIKWEKNDCGDKVEVKVTVENSDDAAKDWLVTVLFDRDAIPPYDSLQSEHHLIIGNGQHTFTFTFTPIEAWQEGEDRESDYYLRVGLSDFIKGETIEQRPWSGPIKLRKDGAVVTQNSVYILYRGTIWDTWEYKVPNDNVYFPKDSNHGVSYVWILASYYPNTDQAKVRVELFDEDNNMVASDESDAVFSILLSGPALR